MKKSVFEKRKHVPRWLVPGCKKGRIPGLIKRHAATVFESVDDQWRLFAEGCLRNRYFHEEVFLRGSKCLGCDRQFNRAEALVSSKIEKHHNDYLRLCTGSLLPENSDDIYRPATKDEFPHVPDCRRCHDENYDYFEGCLKRIFPVHGECHEDIHELERYFRQKARKKLLSDFKIAAE